MSDELSQLLSAYNEAQGKNCLYTDITVFLKEYGEKLHRQYNEINEVYKRLKKAGNIRESLLVQNSLLQLRCQELAHRDFYIEILQRQQDVLTQMISTKETLGS